VGRAHQIAPFQEIITPVALCFQALFWRSLRAVLCSDNFIEKQAMRSPTVTDSLRNRCLILLFFLNIISHHLSCDSTLTHPRCGDVGRSSFFVFSYSSLSHLRQAIRHLTTNLPHSGGGSSSLFQVKSE